MGLACCVDTEQNERQTEKGAQSERFQTQPHWKSVFSFQWKQRNDDYSLNRVSLSWCVHTCVFTPTVNLNSRSLCAACWRGKVNTNTEAAQQSHDHCCSMRTEHDKARCECVWRIFVKKYLWLILGASSHLEFTSVGLTDAWSSPPHTPVLTCTGVFTFGWFCLILTCCCCCPLLKWDS